MGYLSYVKSHKKRSIAIIVVVPLLALLMILNESKIAPVSMALSFWGDVNNVDGVAIDGYDAVAYHVDGVSKKGDASKSFRWNDVNWYFASDVNRSLFMANPDRYAPLYGGYCAYAISKGVTAGIDPDAWIIQDGKLFLMASDDVTTSWLEEEKDGVKAKADERWPTP